MGVIDQLLTDLPASSELFRQRYPHDFLVKRPVTIFQEEIPEDAGEIEYRTVTVSPDDDGIPPWEWFVTGLTKRVGTPFPDQLSVGRAPNCDIVMQFRYVSKAHARFHLDQGRAVALEDRGSSNGTGVNGRPLAPGRPIEIQPGDRLSFGALEVILMTPDELYSVLRYRRNSSASPARSSAG